MPTKRRSQGTGDRLFIPEIGLTDAGSVRVQFRPAPPLRSLYGYERKLAAVIYDVAAELHRRFDELGVGWAVSPEPFRAQLDVELSERDDPDPAAEVVADVLSALGLV